MPRRRPASALRLEAEISEAAVVKLVRVLGPAALLLVAFAALVAALEIGGGASPTLID